MAVCDLPYDESRPLDVANRQFFDIAAEYLDLRPRHATDPAQSE